MSVRKRLATVAIAIVPYLCAPASVGAQIEKGDQSIQVQGQYLQIVSPTSEDPTGLVIAAYNYYVTRKFGVKATAGVIFAQDIGYIAGAGVEYNFSSPGQTTIPFVKLDLLDVKISSANLLSVAPGLGVRFFMTRNTSFDVTGSYNHAIASFDGGSADGGAIQVLLGFSYFFGGGDRR